MPKRNLKGPRLASEETLTETLNRRLHWRRIEEGRGPHDRLVIEEGSSASRNLHGDCTNIYGVASGIGGRVTAELRGDVTGLRGSVTGITGDLDACSLTPKQRAAGVSVQSLIDKLRDQR